MCGIIGIVGNATKREVFERLKKLEYRGYDSFGYFDGSELLKDIGQIKIPESDNQISRAIAHTRWATHGGVTKLNAHPHQSQSKKVAIVHNGIIENYQDLKETLANEGYTFISETDSEIIANYLENKLKQKSILQACQDFLQDAKGTFGILVMVEGDDSIYALRRDSPLVLGLTESKMILASDIYAFSDITNKAIFFENDEIAKISDSSYEFYTMNEEKVQKEIKEFVWDQKESTKEEFPHFMIKESMESPECVKRLLFSLEHEQRESLQKLTELIKTKKKVVFVAAGSSYHASLLGVYYLHKCGVEAQSLIASEFENFAFVDESSVVIAISQSGETMDVIEALKYAQSQGATIASMVNVPYSTIQRMSSVSLNILAGQEVCVAATKSFMNQVTLLANIAQQFGFKINLTNLPEKIQLVLDQKEKIESIAKSVADKKDMYILGRGLSYPVAREVSLKIKEITYIHAEGMMGGELKHGTLALIEDGTPVISIISNNDLDMLANTKEVEARGARIIKITNEMEGDVKIQTSNDGKFAMLACLVGMLLAYYIGVEKDLPIDKPRNLAKCVTVK